LIKTYVSIIPRGDPVNIGNFLRLVKNKRPCSSTSADPSSIESIEEISRRKDSYLHSPFLEGPSMDRVIKKPNYFHYTTGEIRKCIDPGEGNDKERTPSATREFKCLLVKEFILYYDSKDIKVFDSSARGKEEYCGPCQLLRITSLALTGMKNSYFLLLQEMFSVRGICLVKWYCRINLEKLQIRMEYIYKIFNGRKI
jgi:hypothetical protein